MNPLLTPIVSIGTRTRGLRALTATLFVCASSASSALNAQAVITSVDGPMVTLGDEFINHSFRSASFAAPGLSMFARIGDTHEANSCC
jgi:hypothetical protein